jgi:hypothetical protein
MAAAFDDLRFEPTALRTKERLGPSAATHSERDGLGFGISSWAMPSVAARAMAHRTVASTWMRPSSSQMGVVGGDGDAVMTATFRCFVGFYSRAICGDISDLAVTILPLQAIPPSSRTTLGKWPSQARSGARPSRGRSS